jgi:hypothetical protein
VIKNGKFERLWKEDVVAYFKVTVSNYLDRMREAMKNIKVNGNLTEIQTS